MSQDSARDRASWCRHALQRLACGPCPELGHPISPSRRRPAGAPGIASRHQSPTVLTLRTILTMHRGYSVTDHGMQSRRSQSRRQSVRRLVARAAVGHRRLAGLNTPPRRWSSQLACHRRGGPGWVVVLLPPVARATARGVRMRLGARPARYALCRPRTAMPIPFLSLPNAGSGSVFVKPSATISAPGL